MTSGTVLLVDAENTSRDGLARLLGADGFQVIVCAEANAALNTLKSQNVDLLVTELAMPGMNGLDLIQRARELRPGAAVIAMISHGQIEMAVDAMKAGATDCLRKPIDIDKLRSILEDQSAQRIVAGRNGAFRGNLLRRHDSAEIVGGAPPTVSLLDTVDRLAQDRTHILISGERGTGKRLLSRAIFMAGESKCEPFYTHHCHEVTEDFFQGEPFSCGAAGRLGIGPESVPRYEDAGRATLALYDIDRLEVGAQAHLLRAVAGRDAATRGGVDLRVIATTSCDLGEAVESGTFHAELFGCLAATQIEVPPLRDRREDIPALIAFFLRKFNSDLNNRCPGITPEAVEVLCGLPWRGNVRDLENAVERALILCDDKEIDVASLRSFGDIGGTAAMPGMRLRDATKVFERGYILSALERLDNNKAAAAKMLGLGLSSLYRKLEDLDIPRNRGRRTGGVVL